MSGLGLVPETTLTTPSQPAPRRTTSHRHTLRFHVSVGLHISCGSCRETIPNHKLHSDELPMSVAEQVELLKFEKHVEHLRNLRGPNG